MPRTIPIRPAPAPAPGASGSDEDIQASLYAARQAIHPRAVSGWFAAWRVALVLITQAAFYGTVWLTWNGRQAVLFDLAARKFYIFGWVLWPQDFIYLAVLLIICAYSLFLFTAIAGRLWCGYACPQTVYTEIFVWIERRIEGDRPARIKLDQSGWTANKIIRRGGKHVVWLMLAAWTGVTFVGYFTPIRELAGVVPSLSLGPWEGFWIGFYSLATYGNAGWMREQVCKYMCPYARFQSAMFDKDTLIITYDAARGEPRGARGRSVDAKSRGLGDCVDCSICVQVCPTGIDIRRGLQYECIGCAACIDGCNQVMDKMGYPRGLIRYTTENALKSGLDVGSMWRRALRARTLIYGSILLLVVSAFAASLVTRTPLKVDVIRDRNTLARQLDEGRVENVYRLQIMNTREATTEFDIRVEGLPGVSIDYAKPLKLDAASARAVPVAVRLARTNGEGASGGSIPIYFVVRSVSDEAIAVREKSVFIVPRRSSGG
jgi:cytochrome c oxidase accessory protein FixG